MKTRLLLSLVGLVVSASSFAAPQTYPIKCRPGSNTSFNISVYGELRFGFVKGPVAAGSNGAGVAPGQCAWVDRPIGAGEPAYIAAPLGPNFKVGAVIPHLFNNTFKAYVYASAQPWVTEFSQKDVILTLNVYNDGQYLRAPNP